MAIELEAKIKVDSCEQTRMRLQELGARRRFDVLEVNQLFDTTDRQLFQAGCGLRIRTCRGQGQVPPATLTYKGPQQPGTLKRRLETETTVGDPDAAVSILEALGLQPVIRFEKRREEWEHQGLTIELDEVPRLGCFVEIEGPDETAVRRLQEKLGLPDRPVIKDSYIALLIDHAREHGLDWSDIRF